MRENFLLRDREAESLGQPFAWQILYTSRFVFVMQCCFAGVVLLASSHHRSCDLVWELITRRL